MKNNTLVAKLKTPREGKEVQVNFNVTEPKQIDKVAVHACSEAGKYLMILIKGLNNDFCDTKGNGFKFLVSLSARS